MWPFFVEIVGYALVSWLTPSADSEKAPVVGTQTATTVEEGRAIPVVFGTVELRAANIVWYGDLKYTPVSD